MENNYCVIMAGGAGTRFWPMSRSGQPKQFLDILGTGKTLLQQTWDRLQAIIPASNIFIVSNDHYREIIIEQLPDIPKENILCEPARKNTAPCIAYACYKIKLQNENANIVVAPSDHIVMNQEEFAACVKRALKFAAESSNMVTLGIRPSRPDTGYGYIQFDENQQDKSGKMYKVKTFTEKPDLEMAKFFIQSGEFLWNSGIFVWSLKAIIEAFEAYLPEMNALFAEAYQSFNTNQEEGLIKSIYTQCANISIDYGIMEKADNVYVHPADFGWSDLGTWGSLHDNSEKDLHNNAVVGNNVMLYDSKNCIVNVPKDKLVVMQGLDGFIVAESDQILLICKKDDEQEIREFVNQVKLNKGEKYI